jgi:succinate dehydrogenase / fumarate reductase cytochrome b subunit
MNTLRLWWTSVGKKLVNAITGLALFGFICVHLAGNLTLFACDGGALFNSYAHHLESLGPLLYAMEIGLVAFFVIHIVSAVSVRLGGQSARPDGYAMTVSKGGPSRQTLSSRSMLVTGILIGLFVAMHVWMFKYNRGRPMPTTEVDGREIKDLYAVVVLAFRQAPIAFGYAAIMLLLGLHLRHGFWSAMQSLGAATPKWSAGIYGAGLVFAVLLAGGFVALPLWIYFGASCGGCGAGGAP